MYWATFGYGSVFSTHSVTCAPATPACLISAFAFAGS